MTGDRNMIQPNAKTTDATTGTGSQGSSPKGFLNEQEFVEAVPKNFRKWAGLGFVAAFGLAILESLSTNYSGPYAPLLIALAGVIGGYVRTNYMAKKFIEDGDDVAD